MEQSHTIGSRQSAQLKQLVHAHNEAQATLQRYFSAIADGLDLPVGTILLRVEDETMVVECPAA